MTRQDINLFLKSHNIENVTDIKDETSRILLYYIDHALSDHIVTKEECFNARYLKLLFKIKGNELLKNNYDEVKTIVDKQLKLIYDDDHVTRKESEHIVDIQELFDLSYAQMDEFKVEHVQKALENGASIKHLDTAHKLFWTKDKSL